MITFKKAYDIVIKSAFSTGVEKVDINSSLNRILSEDVISDINMPPFDKSAMDGYVCKFEDLERELEVIEVIPAGYMPREKITRGTCAKIMTGAMIPEGGECVIIVEETIVTSSGKVKFTGATTRPNICKKSEDIKIGVTLLKRGILIKPSHIAVLATAGCTNLLVAKKPNVGIITTGSELVEPSEKISGAKIRNSNGSQMVAQVTNSGGVPHYYGIIEDTKEATVRAISKALEENDIVLISGGVSMGEYDFVPSALKDNNVKILFDRVAIQPGKPVTFGASQNKVCFGMPGNPVSTFIQFELLVKPFIYKMMGGEYKTVTYQMPLGKEISRKNDSRQAIIPVKLEEGRVYPLQYHGSAHINAFVNTDYVISIPAGVKKLESGTIVDVRQIQ